MRHDPRQRVKSVRWTDLSVERRELGRAAGETKAIRQSGVLLPYHLRDTEQTMKKNIVTVGFELAPDFSRYEKFRSKASLLDWDIILFRPHVEDFYANDQYAGKPSFDDSASFALQEQLEHWRREIKQAYDAGKTVVVFLAPLKEVYVATGEKKYSGTGRNRQVTRIVNLRSNYGSLPISATPVNATGKSMKLTSFGSQFLDAYWSEFGAISEYQVLMTNMESIATIVTKSADKTAGAIYRHDTSSGSIILLPDIDFRPKEFTQIKGGKEYWTSKAVQFAARLTKTVIALDGALHATAEVAPEPAWASVDEYELEKERSLRAELLEIETTIENAQKKKEALLTELRTAGRLRFLLYGKGSQLEIAIVAALTLLGFKASNYKDAQSEFDVVFENEEGRLLGEAEGKDTKAVNVDKLRQLAMNIHEDLQRDEVDQPAKGVLFGNGYRLTEVSKRDVQFTEKCRSAAQTSSTALLATSELYKATQYLADKADEAYAEECRKVIFSGNGLITLPDPPKGKVSKQKETSADT